MTNAEVFKEVIHIIDGSKERISGDWYSKDKKVNNLLIALLDEVMTDIKGLECYAKRN